MLDGQEIAFRPSVTEAIDPRVWHKWYQEKRISENQYFRALSVSIPEARLAVGEDQIGDISHTTLTKTPDIRITFLEKPDPEPEDGDILSFRGDNVPTAREAKERKFEDQQVGTPDVARKRKRKIRL